MSYFNFFMSNICSFCLLSQSCAAALMVVNFHLFPLLFMIWTNFLKSLEVHYFNCNTTSMTCCADDQICIFILGLYHSNYNLTSFI